ncbi:MAG: phage tail family protein, partial [Lachnospiraceae bacterium]|nr:phage tail family protein [Lachnospiraceae bacterium]
MYKLILENRNGAIDLMSYKDFKVIDVDGVGGADADINETENATIDGSIVNSSRIDSREIDISIRILNNCGESRKTIYKYATIKDNCKIILINDIRSVYIEGVVKSIETPLFTDREIMTIKVICPAPYFNAMASIITEFSNIVKKFAFPFAITEDKPVPFSAYSSIIVAEVMNSG